MSNFHAVNNIDFVSDAPDEAYRLRADAKLHKQSNKPLFPAGIYAELSYHATGLAGVYQIISSKFFYIIMLLLLSNRFLGRTASLNPTYANTDLISYVLVSIACIIIRRKTQRLKRISL